MRIGFIYRHEFLNRSANRISMFKNIAAAKSMGHEAVLFIPKDSLSNEKTDQAIETAFLDFGVAERFPVVRIPRPTLAGRGRSSFDLLAAGWAKMKSFDLIWSREINAAYFTSALGLRTILEHHRPFTPRQWRMVRRALRHPAFRGVAAISAVHQRKLVSDGLPENRVMIAHSGVDLSQFAGPREASANLRLRLAAKGQPIVLYAGSLYTGKGGEQVLLAAAQLNNAKFVCIGGRDFEVEQLRKRIESLDLTNVELAGYVPHAEIPDYLSAADVLIAPFTENGSDISGKVIIPFASPIKLFEYMAAGKPIVTSNIGAIPEIVRHGENGLLITPGSADELVQAISRLLSDPSLARRLGDAARRDVRPYVWEERVARILAFARLN